MAVPLPLFFAKFTAFWKQRKLLESERMILYPNAYVCIYTDYSTFPVLFWHCLLGGKRKWFPCRSYTYTNNAACIRPQFITIGILLSTKASSCIFTTTNQPTRNALSRCFLKPTYHNTATSFNALCTLSYVKTNFIA